MTHHIQEISKQTTYKSRELIDNENTKRKRYRWICEDTQTRENRTSCTETRFSSRYDTKSVERDPFITNSAMVGEKNLVESESDIWWQKNHRELENSPSQAKQTTILNRKIGRGHGRGWSRKLPQIIKKTTFGDAEGIFSLIWCKSEFLNFSGQIERQMEDFLRGMVTILAAI